MILTNNWFSMYGKNAKKIHQLKGEITLCNIHKSQLSKKERTGNYNMEKICKICLTVLKTYDDIDNALIHKSNSNNLRSNTKEEFVFNRYHHYFPLPPMK